MNIFIFLWMVVFAGCQAQNTPFLDSSGEQYDPVDEEAVSTRTTPKKVDENCVCGQVNSAREDDDRIINGVEVFPKFKYPWMVALKFQGELICGGSLINSKFVLTAAHCIIERDPTLFELVFGAHYSADIDNNNLTDSADQPPLLRRNVSGIIVHEKYDQNLTAFENDIALLKLASPVNFTKHISPICLPKHSDVYTQPSKRAIIMGWGRTEVSKGASDVLKESGILVVPAASCREQSLWTRLAVPIADTMICEIAIDKGTCQGDSGGPLVVKEATSYTQLGIVSFGFIYRCALQGLPAVYTSVSSYVNFIYTHTNKGRYCRNPDSGQ